MSVRAIHRGPTERPALYLRTTLHSTTRSHAAQARMLWWWSRPSSEWQSSLHEDIQERMRRHQKIMRYKYSKALRRRATWENDDPRPWSWRVARWSIARRCNEKLMSSTDRPAPSPEARREADQSRDSDHRQDLFNSFRSYIDREIARDPYGVLFGRRLQSPPSSNNSSWTSFSWIFEPKSPHAVEAHPIRQAGDPPVGNPSPTKVEQQPPKATVSKATSSVDVQTTFTKSGEGYHIDPISMKKVPQKAVDPAPSCKEPLLKTLFSEHGVDIPVKTYKPHKVFGYEGKATSAKTLQDEPAIPPHSRFGTSRQSEISSLVARAKGNSIDTTAAFTDGPAEVSNEMPTSGAATAMTSRVTPEPDDSTPLFSGTTYAGRARSGQSSTLTNDDWLAKEGFRVAEQTNANITPSTSMTTDSPVQTPQNKLEPSLDRLRSSEVDSIDPAARLQPSLDRLHKKQDARTTKQSSFWQSARDANEEDIDLLRASDVRAATRSARVTKRQLQASKDLTRSKLESDFTGTNAESISAQAHAAEDVPKPAGKFSKSLNAIWNHIREYPSGVVARTIQSTSTFNNDFKKYVRPGKSSELTEKLLFEDKDLSKTASIYKKEKPVVQSPSTDSPEISREEQERLARTNMLKASAEEVKKQNSIINSQVSQLAADLKCIYEDAYGTIDAQHRQPSQQDRHETQEIGPTSSEPTTCAQDPSARLKAVMDGTKELRRELHETGMAIRAIESGRPQTVWNTPSHSSTNFSRKRIDLADRRRAENAVPDTNDGAPQPSSPSAAQTESPTKVPEPVFTPSGSAVWNDEQPPSVEAMQQKPLGSPYIILAQDDSTGQVALSPVSHSSVTSESPANPLLLLSNLHQASEYLAHFERLEKDGYELYGGGQKMLIFRKKQRQEGSNVSQTSTNTASAARSSRISSGQQAATVLDEIPTEIDPVPGPAAPTAPPSHPYDKSEQLLKPRIRRQEHVFSGAVRPGEEPQNDGEDGARSTPIKDRVSIWSRVARGVKRIILTAAALGGAAYTIGFVADGIGAQAQIQQGIDDGHTQGPRKRVVVTGQRPGIFSTESSR